MLWLSVVITLKSLFFRYGVKVGGDEENWNVMLDRYAMENNAHEKRKLIKGIGKLIIWCIFDRGLECTDFFIHPISAG